VFLSVGFQSFQERYPENLGVISHNSGPLHPSYATTEARLRTFRSVPYSVLFSEHLIIFKKLSNLGGETTSSEGGLFIVWGF
jgi:hypothetical protein